MSSNRRFACAWTLSALALALAAGGGALASPIDSAAPDGPRHEFSYSTTARLDDFGPWPLPGLAFQGVQGQTVQSASPFPAAAFPDALPEGSTVDFPLGRLVIDAPSQGIPQGSGTFQIEVRVEAVDGVRLADPLLATIQGFASVVLRADGETMLRYGVVGYEVHPPYTPPLPTAGHFAHDELSHSLLVPDLHHEFATSSGSSFSLDARLLSARIYHNPEPSTWLVFAAAITLAGARLRRNPA